MDVDLHTPQTRRDARCTALRHGLPFGVVMATGGAAVVASRCGLPALVAPLLALAILQALGLPLVGAWRHRAEFGLGWRSWWALGPAHEHTGVHTVPLALAVIASGLVALAAQAVAPCVSALAAACLVLTWLLTAVCGSRCLWALATRGSALRAFDGAWFLVPAAFLGAAIPTHAVASGLTGPAAGMLEALALAGALVGGIGYWIVAGVALVRVRRHGLGGVPQAPWWIAMGCAGLAAAALGTVAASERRGGPLEAFLIAAMVATAVVAVILCVPVLACSVTFLLRRCRFRGPAAWPPTFSTAVFALGCLETGAVLPSAAFRNIGLGAGYVTLAFWAVTTAWNARRTIVDRVCGSDREIP